MFKRQSPRCGPPARKHTIQLRSEAVSRRSKHVSITERKAIIISRLRVVALLLFFTDALSVRPAQAWFHQAQVAQTSGPFEEYFQVLSDEKDFGSDRSWQALERLEAAVPKMTAPDVRHGIEVIDAVLDSTDPSQKPWTKLQATLLLRPIAFRDDGPELLSSQLARLESMLNDPAHLLSAQALLVLQTIGYRRPPLIWPILEAALRGSEVNNRTGVGPGIATILLFMGPHGDDVTEHVAEYMRRPDITDDQLSTTILGINNSPVIPALLTGELVRCLDRPNEQVKTHALEGIARSTPEAKAAARVRLQKMANDSQETPNVRRMAADVLEKQAIETPGER